LELTLIFATHHKHSYDSLAQDRKFSFLGLVMAVTQRGNCQLGTHLHCDAAPWRWRAGCLRGSGNTRGSQRLASGFGRREEPGVSSSLRAQGKASVFTET
ncbi:hypothetical protein O3P69_016194, partial [Scylla paramamosain]